MSGGLDWRLAIAAVLLAFSAGAWNEHRVTGAQMDLANATAKTELKAATDRAKAAETKLAGTDAAIDAARTQEKENAKTTIDALRGDVRSGAVSLSIATRALRAGPTGADPSAGYVETRSELVPQAAIDLIDIAADGDDAMRDLNACIAKYDAVRQAINP